MTRTLLRVRILAAFAALIFFALVAPAFAQEAPAAGGIDLESILGIVGVIASALVGLYAVGAKLVDRMAARPQVDKWDEIKGKLDEFSPWVEKVKRWADPDDPSIPPTPANPSGLEE